MSDPQTPMKMTEAELDHLELACDGANMRGTMVVLSPQQARWFIATARLAASPSPAVDAELEEDRRVCEAATPGPWEWHHAFQYLKRWTGQKFQTLLSIVYRESGTKIGISANDAVFIARASTRYPALLQQLAIAERENQRLRQDDGFRAYAGSEVACDLIALLDSAGCGKTGKSNCVYNMVQELTADRDLLANFKAYVHKRLDDAGIPVDPDSPHKAVGCRIGGRLDIALRCVTRQESQT